VVRIGLNHSILDPAHAWRDKVCLRPEHVVRMKHAGTNEREAGLIVMRGARFDEGDLRPPQRAG
jgi:hypothetical protein